MKRQDYNIVLETHEEVFDVFFMPENWDYRAGSSMCAFCAAYHSLHLHEEEAHKASITFANEVLKNYWKSLSKSKQCAFFDFNMGIEEDNSIPCRHSEDVYLMAAKYIAKTGVDTFAVDMVITDGYMAIRFTNKSGRSFLFKDTVDVNMFLSAKEVYKGRALKTQSHTMLEEFELFINTEKK